LSTSSMPARFKNPEPAPCHIGTPTTSNLTEHEACAFVRWA
jgi:hypothetical protein